MQKALEIVIVPHAHFTELWLLSLNYSHDRVNGSGNLREGEALCAANGIILWVLNPPSSGGIQGCYGTWMIHIFLLTSLYWYLYKNASFSLANDGQKPYVVGQNTYIRREVGEEGQGPPFDFWSNKNKSHSRFASFFLNSVLGPPMRLKGHSRRCHWRAIIFTHLPPLHDCLRHPYTYYVSER